MQLAKFVALNTNERANYKGILIIPKLKEPGTLEVPTWLFPRRMQLTPSCVCIEHLPGRGDVLVVDIADKRIESGKQYLLRDGSLILANHETTRLTPAIGRVVHAIVSESPALYSEHERGKSLANTLTCSEVVLDGDRYTVLSQTPSHDIKLVSENDAAILSLDPFTFLAMLSNELITVPKEGVNHAR